MIEGQHIVEVMSGMMNNSNSSNHEDIKAYCSFHEIILVWWLGKEKVMYMSKVLILKIHDKDARPTFFEDVSQGRAIWVDHAKPQNLQNWVWCVCPLGGLLMQMLAHSPFV